LKYIVIIILIELSHCGQFNNNNDNNKKYNITEFYSNGYSRKCYYDYYDCKLFIFLVFNNEFWFSHLIIIRKISTATSQNKSG
jgi:hypothetical protein